MEIKECESSSMIMDKMKTKLEEIKDKIISYYKNELIIYNYRFEYNSQHLAEKILTKQRLFLIINNDQEELRDIFKVSFYNRELVITVTDPSEFIYPLVKDEFTKFAEENKNSIKSVCFVKEF